MCSRAAEPIQLYQMEKVDQEGDMNLYKNSGALSLGFMVKDDIIDWTTDSTDHFEVQNDFVTMATGIDEDLLNWKRRSTWKTAALYTIELPAGKQVYLDVTSSVSSIEITTPDYTRTYDTLITIICMTSDVLMRSTMRQSPAPLRKTRADR